VELGEVAPGMLEANRQQAVGDAPVGRDPLGRDAVVIADDRLAGHRAQRCQHCSHPARIVARQAADGEAHGAMVADTASRGSAPD